VDPRAAAEVLADALRELVSFVATRPADATEDDDVRALEDVARVLSRVAPEERGYLRELLGDEPANALGFV
jgi:hypothetical protein